MIKAIETKYKGYRFRSRLEARWAVFFDNLGVKWEYEPEGFETDAGWYLPDFWLPESKTWLEIKGGEVSKADMVKPVALSKETFGEMKAIDFALLGDERWYFDFFSFCEGMGADPLNEIEEVRIEHAGKAKVFVAYGMIDKMFFCSSKHVVQANPENSFLYLFDTTKNDIRMSIVAARSARFEHGETPSFTGSGATDRKPTKFEKDKEILEDKFLIGKSCHYSECTQAPRNIGDFDDMPSEWRRMVVLNCDVDEVERFCVAVCHQHYHENGHDGYCYSTGLNV